MKPMLAKDAIPEKLRYPLIVQPKLDGIRACVVDGKLVTRTLKPVPNAEIRAALERPEFEGFDGELIVGEPTAEDAYRRTTSFVMAAAKTGEPWAFHAFDLWNHPGTFEQRYAALRKIVRLIDWTPSPIFVVENYVARDEAALNTYEAALVEAGHEGVIVRDPAGTYKFGRSYPTDGKLLKVKRYIDFEAEVVGVYEEQHNGNDAKTNALGRTERSTAKAGKIGKGTLGGLILRAINGPAAGVEFRCGTGFDAADRIELWILAQYGFAPDGEGLNGRIAKVKSFPIGVKDKPRHPVWLGWRDMEAGS